MATFPNPEFIHDKDSGQYLFFTKFIAMLNRNYVALSMEAHDQMLDFVSDACEAFYQCSQAKNGYKEMYYDSKAEIQDLTEQTA